MADEEKYTLSLRAAYSFAAERNLQKEANEIRNMVIEWDSYTSSVRRGYIVDLFKEKGVFDDFKALHWKLGNTPDGERILARYARIRKRYEDFLAGRATEPPVKVVTAGDEDRAFAAEADLRDFLARNPDRIEDGLKVYSNGERSGVEYPVDAGFIDILAVDKNGQFVVIELKVGQGRNRTVGQLSYYMGWIDSNLAKSPCRGMIIAKEIPQDLRIAVKRVAGVTLHQYRLSVTVEQVT